MCFSKWAVFLFFFLKVDPFCSLIYDEAIIPGKTGCCRLRVQEEQQQWLMSRFLNLIGGKLENSLNLRTFRRSLRFPQTVYIFAYSAKCRVQINSALHTWLHLHRNAFMHAQRACSLLLQGRADAAETEELVSLVNKQWEAAGSLHWASKL